MPTDADASPPRRRGAPRTPGAASSAGRAGLRRRRPAEDDGAADESASDARRPGARGPADDRAAERPALVRPNTARAREAVEREASRAPVGPGAAREAARDAAAAGEVVPDEEPASPAVAPASRARNTAIFSVLTFGSRIAGLVRDVLTTALFSTAWMSAWTLAFQIPNLLRSLFADAALSAAFVPAFTDELEAGRRQRAFDLAASLLTIITVALGTLTVAAALLTPVVLPFFFGDELPRSLYGISVGLTQMLMPLLVLLGVNGLLVGVANAHDQFTIQALSPLVWNVVIVVVLLATRGLFDGPQQLYAYAIGVLVGTVVQVLMILPTLRRIGFRIRFSPNWRSPEARGVLVLMLPVALGLGLVNFNLLINTLLGQEVSAGAARQIDLAFRIYMLPQGIFSVAIATVLFPALSRAVSRADLDDLRGLLGSGMRQILVLLVPAAAASAVLAVPIIRLVFERGEFTPTDTRQAAIALAVFAASLPLNGLNLLMTRTFFALKQPWATTWIAALNLLTNALVSLLLYRPLGLGGIVLGTVIANVATVGAQLVLLRPELAGRLDLGRTIGAGVRVVLAAALLAAAAYGVHLGLDGVLGRSLLAQVVSVGVALAAGTALYGVVILRLGVPEAQAAGGMIARRLGRS